MLTISLSKPNSFFLTCQTRKRFAVEQYLEVQEKLYFDSFCSRIAGSIRMFFMSAVQLIIRFEDRVNMLLTLKKAEMGSYHRHEI